MQTDQEKYEANYAKAMSYMSQNLKQADIEIQAYFDKKGINIKDVNIFFNIGSGFSWEYKNKALEYKGSQQITY